jgi:hypothetical protein
LFHHLLISFLIQKSAQKNNQKIQEITQPSTTMPRLSERGIALRNLKKRLQTRFLAAQVRWTNGIHDESEDDLDDMVYIALQVVQSHRYVRRRQCRRRNLCVLATTTPIQHSPSTGGSEYNNMSATKDVSKLTMAAEEQIKAASTHVESSSLTIGKETVEGLKRLSENSTSIEKSVEALKLSHDSKMNTLIQSIAELKKETTELNAIVVLQTAQAVLQTKHQALEWAISNAEMGSFKYYNKDDRHKDDRFHCYGPSQVASTELVRAALMKFRKGFGRYIDKRGLTPTLGGKEKNEESEKNFRDALSAQIHNLTGQKPRIAMTDGRYVIYCS